MLAALQAGGDTKAEKALKKEQGKLSKLRDDLEPLEARYDAWALLTCASRQLVSICCGLYATYLAAILSFMLHASCYAQQRVVSHCSDKRCQEQGKLSKLKDDLDPLEARYDTWGCSWCALETLARHYCG